MRILPIKLPFTGLTIVSTAKADEVARTIRGNAAGLKVASEEVAQWREAVKAHEVTASAAIREAEGFKEELQAKSAEVRDLRSAPPNREDEIRRDVLRHIWEVVERPDATIETGDPDNPWHEPVIDADYDKVKEIRALLETPVSVLGKEAKSPTEIELEELKVERDELRDENEGAGQQIIQLTKERDDAWSANTLAGMTIQSVKRLVALPGELTSDERLRRLRDLMESHDERVNAHDFPQHPAVTENKQLKRTGDLPEIKARETIELNRFLRSQINVAAHQLSVAIEWLNKFAQSTREKRRSSGMREAAEELWLSLGQALVYAKIIPDPDDLMSAKGRFASVPPADVLKAMAIASLEHEEAKRANGDHEGTVHRLDGGSAPLGEGEPRGD